MGGDKRRRGRCGLGCWSRCLAPGASQTEPGLAGGKSVFTAMRQVGGNERKVVEIEGSGEAKFARYSVCADTVAKLHVCAFIC